MPLQNTPPMQFLAPEVASVDVDQIPPVTPRFDTLTAPSREAHDQKGGGLQLPGKLLRTIDFIGHVSDHADSFLPFVRYFIESQSSLPPIRREISESGERSVRGISAFYLGVSAAVGGFYYDLCGADFGRRRCEELASKLCAVTIIFDHWIDERPGTTVQKLKLLDQFQGAFERGEIPGDWPPLLRKAAGWAGEIGRFASSQRHGDAFFAEIRSLVAVAKLQVNGEGTLDLACRMSGHTNGMLLLLPMCTLPNLDVAKLQACRHLGAFIQLADDIKDYERDKQNGITNYLTTAASIEEAVKDARTLAMKHVREALKLLEPEDRKKLRAIGTLMSCKWSAFGADAWISSAVMDDPALRSEIKHTPVPRTIDPWNFDNHYGVYRGPFFIQERVGREGRPIHVYKLRTMDPEIELPAELAEKARLAGKMAKIENDPRVSRTGRFLRQWFIDEIPQLWSVLRGDLRFVGPRPMTPGELKTYPQRYIAGYEKHGPGLVSCLYGHEVTGQVDQIAVTLRYFDERSKAPLKTDLKYFLQAVWGIAFGGQRGI